MSQVQLGLFDTLDAGGVTAKEIAYAAGVSQSLICRAKTGQRAFTIEQLRSAMHRLKSSNVRDVLAWLAGYRPDVTILPVGQRAANAQRQCSVAQRELADIADAVAVAMADGVIDERERCLIEVEKSEALLAVSRV